MWNSCCKQGNYCQWYLEGYQKKDCHSIHFTEKQCQQRTEKATWRNISKCDVGRVKNHNCSAKEILSCVLCFPIKPASEKQTKLSLQKSNEQTNRRDTAGLAWAYVI